MLLTRLGVVVVAFATVVLAQEQPYPAPAQIQPKPSEQAIEGGTPAWIRAETPQQRQARLGTTEDPGLNPDPNKEFFRFGKAYHIERYDRRWAVSDCHDLAWIRPFGAVNICREIYQQSDKYVWIWEEIPMPGATATQAPAPEEPKYDPKAVAYLESIRGEFKVLEPPAAAVTIQFEESSHGLPDVGSWRNSVAVADMNEDGKMDIIAPPERGRPTTPVVFLGDGKGTWKPWLEVVWPIPLDYGSVAAADLNKDGHQDLIFGIHLRGVSVLLGDGKGQFTDASAGLPNDFPTRRAIIADVDKDGYPDIVAISEGPTALQRVEDASYGKVRAFLNRSKARKWEGFDIARPDRLLGGDWLSVANLNSDGYPDFLGASIYFGGFDTIWVSKGKSKWESAETPDALMVPLYSYYHASTAGKFTSKTRDDGIVAFVRFWPQNVSKRVLPDPPATTIAGVDRISVAGGKATRKPLMRWPSSTGSWGMGAGDFNGDGSLDIAFTRFEPRDLVILLGDGKGSFRRAQVEGVTLPPNTNYDLKVVDVNGDSRPDLVISFEAETGETSFLGRRERNGAIRVFLNRGDEGRRQKDEGRRK